jgi:hypothetical protein
VLVLFLAKLWKLAESPLARLPIPETWLVMVRAVFAAKAVTLLFPNVIFSVSQRGKKEFEILRNWSNRSFSSLVASVNQKT